MTPPAGGHIPIHPGTSVGPVRLTVADPDRMQVFYQRAIGLRTIHRSDEGIHLGVEEASLVELVARPDAPVRPRRTTGLFHLAILVPSRLELARAIRRVIEADWSFSGASDHLVSEAMYLDDPEGNGMEIYRDRPREEWRNEAGELEMATLPLDIDDILGELPGPESGHDGMAPGTRIGHVHLQVADLSAAQAFYHDTLGFDVVARGVPGALFVSAGGYHHHIGLNTWASAGAPAPPTGSRGLGWFAIVVPDIDELERVEKRLGAAGIEAERLPDGNLGVADPSANQIRLTSRSA